MTEDIGSIEVTGTIMAEDIGPIEVTDSIMIENIGLKEVTDSIKEGRGINNAEIVTEVVICADGIKGHVTPLRTGAIWMKTLDISDEYLQGENKGVPSFS